MCLKVKHSTCVEAHTYGYTCTVLLLTAQLMIDMIQQLRDCLTSQMIKFDFCLFISKHILFLTERKALKTLESI